MLIKQRLILCLNSTAAAACIFCSCSPMSNSSDRNSTTHSQTAQKPTEVPNILSFSPPIAPESPAVMNHESTPQLPPWPLPSPKQDSGVSQSNEQPQPAPIVQQPKKLEPAPKPQTKPKPSDKPSRTAASQQSNSKKQLTLAQLVKKYPDLLLLRGSTSSNKVALTFDDAPDTKYTPEVLNILKKYNVKATFFVVGQLVEKHPTVVKRMIKEGHVVGNHTYNHSLLTKLNDEQFQVQVNKTQKLLRSTIGYTPKLLRPPYGEISESQLLWASSHQLVVVNWNVDSKDWKQLSQAQVSSNILNHAKAGSIILQHAGGGPNQDLSGTVSALPTIIESLQSRGYQLVTLPELLQIPKQL